MFKNIKKFIEEFKAFALRGNMMDMAIGVLIGGAFTSIVTSLTENFITPVITTVLSLIGGAPLYTAAEWYGFASNFVSAIFNFFITALVLFLLLKAMNKLMELGKKKDEEPAAPTTKKCPYCLSEIPVEATRCPHCTSQLEENKETVHA